jgi:ABC-type branched-subunit amino acid transport system ATPase component
MILHLDAICGGYGDTLVHRDLSLLLPAGQITAIVGRNGTGKTTLARLIAGDLPLATGVIRLEGKEIGHLSAHARARRGIVTMPQTGMVFDTLSVRENLQLTGGDPGEIATMAQTFPRLGDRMTQRAGSMSGGERKILGFARAMLGKARVVVLDEPSEGVQPENIQKMQALITGQKVAGAAILLLEQNVSMIVAIADRVQAIDTDGFTFSLERPHITREAVIEALEI